MIFLLQDRFSSPKENNKVMSAWDVLSCRSIFHLIELVVDNEAELNGGPISCSGK